MNLAPTGKSAVGLTRAQVQAELFKARADRSPKVWSSARNPVLICTSERTRDAGRAEAIAANREGDGHSYYGDDSGAIALASQQRPAADTAPFYAGTVKRAQ